jgi:hypothetical protein
MTPRGVMTASFLRLFTISRLTISVGGLPAEFGNWNIVWKRF